MPDGTGNRRLGLRAGAYGAAALSSQFRAHLVGLALDAHRVE
jgi:hypothetical protein